MAFSFPFRRLTEAGARLAEQADRNFEEASRAVVAAQARLTALEADAARIAVLEGVTIPNGTITPPVPHTRSTTATQAGGTSSTTYVDMATPLQITTFVKAHASTVLILTVTGHAWVDDAVVDAFIAVDIGGVDYEIINIDTLLANYAAGVAGVRQIAGIPAGAIANIKAQRRVGAGTTVFTPNGRWSLTVTETWV